MDKIIPDNRVFTNIGRIEKGVSEIRWPGYNKKTPKFMRKSWGN